MAKDFVTTIQFLAEPTINGTLNPNYVNPYAWAAASAARKRFGVERVEKAVRDYRQDNPKFRNWRY